MSLAYVAAVSLMLAVPLLLAITLRRRFRAPWLLWSERSANTKSAQKRLPVAQTATSRLVV